MLSEQITGFSEWMKILLDNYNDLLKALPRKTGVYVMRYEEAFGRFVGESDIIYIGKTDDSKGIRGRIRQHLRPGPTQETAQRVNDFLYAHGQEGEIEVAYYLCEKGRTRGVEGSLLNRYFHDHQELPPLNRSN